jgi:hypothetical protein
MAASLFVYQVIDFDTVYVTKTRKPIIVHRNQILYMATASRKPTDAVPVYEKAHRSRDV